MQTLVTDYHFELRQQAGLRIGLLICDNRTLVYSPTPLLIEAGSTSQEKPNAVWVGQDMPKTLAKACLLGTEGEIGQRAATPASVADSLLSLKNEPPKKFEIARVERVYHSKIQFIELEVTGYRLSSKKITIPNDLLIGDDKALNEKLKNSFQLLTGVHGVVGGMSGVFSPEVRCIYKAVTYESIKDEKFLNSMKESMRKKGLGSQAQQLFSEYDAAREA